MDNLKEKALILHSQGYNCAQAVCAVFADRAGLDEDMLFRFGKDSKIRTKGQTYRLTAKMNNEFAERVGSIYCKDIKGIETGNVLKSCDGCILEAVSIIEEYIFNNK